jgi:hypothetical protein
MTLARLQPANGRPRRRNLGLRIADLETFYGTALEGLRGPSEAERSAKRIAEIRAILAERGVQQQAHESLFEALARALEVHPRVLRAYIEERSREAAPSR